MSRYFFHVEDGRSYPDHEGTELVDIDAARVEAVRMFGALLGDNPEAFWNGDEWTLRCTDDGQMTLFKIHFYAIDARPRHREGSLSKNRSTPCPPMPPPEQA